MGKEYEGVGDDGVVRQRKIENHKNVRIDCIRSVSSGLMVVM